MVGQSLPPIRRPHVDSVLSEPHWNPSVLITKFVWCLLPGDLF
jgi:hypothetical protein